MEKILELTENERRFIKIWRNYRLCTGVSEMEALQAICKALCKALTGK